MECEVKDGSIKMNPATENRRWQGCLTFVLNQDCFIIQRSN
jgi:hypothetical protein